MPVSALEGMSVQQLIESSRFSAAKAQKTSSKKKQKRYSSNGRTYAERCIEIAPDEAGCYYWRAVNTGLYYQARILGYQRGIKQMIDDCNKIIALGKAEYDNAGAYRIQGEIFTHLPQTGGSPDSIVRDLEKAEAYLREAVRIAPEYPENRIALAETLYMLDKFEEALTQLVLAKENAPKWKSDISYHDWQKNIAKMMRKIEKKR